MSSSAILERSNYSASAAAAARHPAANLPTEADASRLLKGSDQGSPELREAFNDFVGQTLFGSMLAEMRKGLEGPAYFGGGRTEEVFQGQLDQVLVERISKASSDKISEPMYDLFMMGRG